MAAKQGQLEIKFRLIDGSDIGPEVFFDSTSVATLKERIIAQWPKEKGNGPKTVKDIKLISAGKVLENSKTVGECRTPLSDNPGFVTTMHVVVQRTPSAKAMKSLLHQLSSKKRSISKQETTNLS